MSLKLDTEQFDALLAIRRRATELGYSSDEVTAAFREARDESNIQSSNESVSDVKPPESPSEPQKEERQPKREQRLSQRATESHSRRTGLNPSGGKVRQSKISILDLADKRVTR